LSEKFNIECQRNPCILLAPLDWGLGHTTRCIPIISYFLANGCDVILAGDHHQLALLKNEFPSLRLVYLRGYELKFSNNRLKTIVKIFLQIPKILAAIRRENRWLQRFAMEKRIDAIVSDNRYGFFSNQIYSVFITHQLTIKTPFGNLSESILRKLNYQFIFRFKECWVPDTKEPGSLAGELANPPSVPPFPVYYIGNLSRFTARPEPEKKTFVLIMISGPEPQRSIFERRILEQTASLIFPVHIVRGLPGNQPELPETSSNVIIENHSQGSSLQQLISEASFIISRPGYTTVMEMLSCGKQCIFIPTPGQTEQEYLGKHLAKKGYSLYASQSDFRLSRLLKEAEDFTFVKYQGKHGPDQAVMNEFLLRIRTTLSDT
jgi:uncharacterized protein (TIGR00661 family)